jgi:hypothetical protein
MSYLTCKVACLPSCCILSAHIALVASSKFKRQRGFIYFLASTASKLGVFRYHVLLNPLQGLNYYVCTCSLRLCTRPRPIEWPRPFDFQERPPTSKIRKTSLIDKKPSSLYDQFKVAQFVIQERWFECKQRKDVHQYLWAGKTVSEGQTVTKKCIP